MSDTYVPEIAVNHAILHILDFTTRLNILSESELDVSSDSIYGYIFRHLYKTAEDPRQKKVSFKEEANLRNAVIDYRKGNTGFIDLSDAIAERFIGFFTEHPDLQAFDLLIADYTLDLRPMIAVLVLDNVQAWTHHVDHSSGMPVNELVEHHAVLPSPSKKIRSYALIDTSSLEIRCVDEMKTSADRDPQIIRNVLECTDSRSAAEVVKMVRKMVEQVAEDHEENAALIMAKTKQFMLKSAENSSELSPADLAEEVFEDAPVMMREFHEMVRNAELPEKVEMPYSAAKKVSAKQKLKTDTGIEISVPAELMTDPEFIEFTTGPDGKTQIILKRIGMIMNRS